MTELEKNAQKEVELIGKKQKKVQELTEVEEAQGREFLETGKSKIGRVLKLKAELGMIDSALKACRASRGNAIKAKVAAEAAGLRRQIGEKQSELESHEAKRAKHLAALSELEDVVFTPLILGLQPVDPFMPSRGYYAPRSAKLRAEIDSLQRQAGELSRWQVPDSGSVSIEGTSIDQLLMAVMTHSSLVPNAEDVMKWHAACEAQSSNDSATF